MCSLKCFVFREQKCLFSYWFYGWLGCQVPVAMETGKQDLKVVVCELVCVSV